MYALDSTSTLCYLPDPGGIMGEQNGQRSKFTPPRFATLELCTNTPCPICGSQNPGLFNPLMNDEGQYHLISFCPGKPNASCIFYQRNISEYTSRYQFYKGNIFGSPTVLKMGLFLPS